MYLWLQSSDNSLADTYVETTDELLGRANKNNLSKALLYMQKAYLMSNDGKVSKEQKKLLEVSSIFRCLFFLQIVISEILCLLLFVFYSELFSKQNIVKTLN